ncbi:hypothetical protein K469DRAFT_781601, partial [Zopfia rhizophila CBS 207.26]
MCGWSLFRKSMEETLQAEEGNDPDDIFERSDEEKVFESSDLVSGLEKSKLKQEVEWLRGETEFDSRTCEPSVEVALKNIPIFLGHGTEDEKESFESGRLASGFLRILRSKFSRRIIRGWGIGSQRTCW